jgi:transcriptional regulator with XRE-family HTH domain
LCLALSGATLCGMPHSPYIARVFFGRAIQKYRLRANFSVPEAAAKTGISAAKLRKLETATNDSIKLPDAYACSGAYGCSSEEAQDLLDLVAASDSPGWYQAFDVPAEFERFLEMEGAASEILVYEQGFVWGPTQTEAYTEGLKQHRPGTKGGADTGLRRRRREVLLSSDGPTITYLADEAALHRAVGGREVMRDQVRHLVELSELPNVTVLVVPFAAGAHESMHGSYESLSFRDAVFPTTVYLESLHGRAYEDDQRKVDQYAGVSRETMNHAIDIREFIHEDHGLA